MLRCFQLARLGQGRAAPNPVVGAVLVHGDQIIGEGYHAAYGGPHAEVNCLSSVPEAQRRLVPEAVLYVSLEPCAHFGKTPPCADLVISSGIKRVVVGCTDPFAEVAGRGIQKMEAAGIEVVMSELSTEAKRLNQRFFTFHQEKRPYVVLKWAQSANGMIGAGPSPVRISNDYSNRIVHQWRAEEHAIMIGTNTAALDTPSLTTRLYPGRNPKRVLIDQLLRVPPTGPLFDGRAETIILNSKRSEVKVGLTYSEVTEKSISAYLAALHGLDVQSVLVEGGARLLQSFIDSGLWDEARIITANNSVIETGVRAPVMRSGTLVKTAILENDSIHTFSNENL